MAKRGLKRGRWIIAGGLTVFVLVSAAVVARRSYGYREGLELTALRRKRANLESERVRLDKVIRDASSRPRLLPIAERRLGMHLPDESQVVILARPSRASGPP